MESETNTTTTNQSPTQYLDPVVLSSLGNLELSSRLVVEGFISGLHKSPFHGFNVEFAEHRQYLAGDDVRHIDWKAAAKSDKLYLKQFEEETNLKAYFVLDTSGSMAFPESGISKLEYSKLLISSLTYLLLRQRDAAGFFGIAEGVSEFVPPRGHIGHLHAILDSLGRMTGSGETTLAQGLAEIAERINRRGLIIIVSDLLGNREGIMESLRLLRHRKHDVLVFQILSPEELEFPYRGYTRFQDLESEGQLLTDPGALRNEYLLKLNQMLEFYRTGCLQHHLDYSLVRLDDHLDKVLATYLHRRMNRLKG